MTARYRRGPVELPAHYIRDRARWRRLAMRHPGLSKGARLYAAELAFRRWGAGTVAWSRREAAARFGCSVRTVQRWIRELREVGLVRVFEQGTIIAGRRYLQILVLMSAQVSKGDTNVSPTGTATTGPPSPTRQPSPAGPTAAAHTTPQTGRPVNRPWSRPTTPAEPDLFTPDPDRTTTSRPAHPVSAML